jgi:hypothetical protein
MNYTAQVLSNTFKVKDTELVKRLLGSAGFYVDQYEDRLCFYDNEDSAYLCDMNVVFYNGIPIVVQTDYNDDEDFYAAIEEYTGIKEEDIDDDLIETQDFFIFLQTQLLEGESIKVTEVGHEGLRYQGACGVVVTTKGYKWFDLNKIMDEYAA